MTTITTLTAKFPLGSLVRVQDITLRPLRKPRSGVVKEIRAIHDGGHYLMVQLKDSTIDTLPANVKLTRRP